jgi:hypothetical protein
MNLNEFAELTGKSLKEAEEILKNEEVITLDLSDRKSNKVRESFRMEVIQ